MTRIKQATMILCLECWIENMGLDNFVFTNNMRLCSDHFEEERLQNDGNLVKIKSGSMTGKFSSTCERACELEFAHCYLINFTYATCI